MKWTQKIHDVSFIFTALRVATVLVGLLGTWFALILGSFGLFAASSTPFSSVNVAAGAGLATVVLVSVCCYAALFTFFRLCGRLARASAFTEENARAMRRLSQLMLACGIAVLAGLTAVHLVLVLLPTVYLFLFVPAFFGASLLCHALSVLVRRAAALQDEHDLTV